jgi:predicted transcriptional regulator
VLECFIAADKVYGEDQANEFAKDFKWKESQLTEDLAAYVESGHDIGVMVSVRQEMEFKASREAPERKPGDIEPDQLV